MFFSSFSSSAISKLGCNSSFNLPQYHIAIDMFSNENHLDPICDKHLLGISVALLICDVDAFYLFERNILGRNSWNNKCCVNIPISFKGR